MMETALENRLAAAGPIAALGAGVSWDDRPPQVPWVTLTKVAPGREYTHSGPDNLDNPRVQFDCWAGTKTERAALAKAVRDEMETAGTFDQTRFDAAFLEAEFSTRDEDLPGQQAVFRTTLDFTFYHEEIPA